MKELKKDNRAMTNRIANAETRIAQLEDNCTAHQTTISELRKEVSQLEVKVTYPDSNSRRNNLLLVGLEEGLLEGTDSGGELAAILKYILGRGEVDPAPAVDRHHRALRPRPGPSDPPRPYIIRLLRWSDRQLILRAAAKKERLVWKSK